MLLTNRLKAVADMVPVCSVVADIGTDHAYIPIYLVQNGIAKEGIASDISEGPAKIARQNIEKYGLVSEISVVVGDGLEGIPYAEVIIIAGMGGKMICDILENGEQTAKAAQLLVLQPMTMACELRKYLHGAGFEILSETLAKEDEKLYNILVVKAGSQSYGDEIFYHLGKSLIDERHPLLGEYIQKRVNALEIALNGMDNSLGGVDKRNGFAALRNAFMEVYDDFNS